jgi:hypothetical protein
MGKKYCHKIPALARMKNVSNDGGGFETRCNIVKCCEMLAVIVNSKMAAGRDA